MYWVTFYLRWSNDAGFERYQPLLIDYGKRSVPAWQRPLLPLLAPVLLQLVRHKMKRQVSQQGTGRHSYDEVIAIGLKGWQAIATLLGQQPYLLGDTISSIDASGFAFLHTLAKHPFPSAVQDYVLSQPGLMAYHDRIWQRYWQ